MAKHRETITVSAACGDEVRSQTRSYAASAMVLADRWAAQGCQNIRLTDSRGQSRTREVFRSGMQTNRHLRGLSALV